MRHQERDPNLETLVRTALKPLFDNDAQVITNERLPGIGNSQIFIRVLDIELRIIQTGGGISVLAAPRYTTHDWHSVESLLMAIDHERTLPPKPVYGSLADLGCILDSRLHRLNDALSRERFASTVEAARQSTMRGMIALEPPVAAKAPAARRVVPVVIRGIAKIVHLLAPNSKDNRAKFLPIGSDKELEQQVRQEFANAFTEFGAQISSNGRLRIMDFATVTFDAGNLRVRASRDRGSIDVSVAPIHAVRLWHDLGIALQALQEDEEIAHHIPSSMLLGTGRLFERDFVRLNDAFSEVKYPAIEMRISRISERRKQSWAEDFNRNSKYYHATMP
jgi:hypothetical protein